MNLVRLWQNTFSSSPQAENAEDRQEENDFLPGELAGQILDLEIDCEGPNACKELIGELIALYANAIEFYEAKSSPKYEIYRKRMQSFLSRSSINSILNGQVGSLAIKKERVERNRLMAMVSSKQEANKIIETCNQRSESNKKMAQKVIVKQEQELNARIERRKSMSNRSTTSQNNDFDETSTSKRGSKEHMNVGMILSGIKQRNVKRVFI